MFENFKKVVGIGLLAGAGAVALEQDSSKHMTTLENVATKYYQSSPGENITIDLTAEIPEYRLNELQNGSESVGIYCAVQGSDQGSIDSKNVILPYGKIHETALSFELPKPGAEYDGSWGYGYFIICGKEGVLSDKGIEADGKFVRPDFSKRIVYLVLPNSKKDTKSTFLIK